MDVFSESRLGRCAKYFTLFGLVSCAYVALRLVLFILVPVFRMLRRACCGSVDFKKYGTWAVITGSTDGIGKSYVIQLAEKGMDVVLVSRNAQKLARVAEEIRRQHKVRVKTLTADFTRTDIYGVINQQLQELDIGVLVNNVAILHKKSPQYYHLMDDYLQFSMDSVNVNIMSCVMMTGLVLPRMLEKGRGLIINIGSGAGLFDTPFFGAYPATKAFMMRFSTNLQQEYASKGITVQLLTPCFIQTNMANSLCQAMGLTASLFYPTADRFVRSALRTVQTESFTTGYWPHDLQVFLYTNAPGWLLRKIFLEAAKKRQEQEKNKTL